MNLQLIFTPILICLRRPRPSQRWGHGEFFLRLDVLQNMQRIVKCLTGCRLYTASRVSKLTRSYNKRWCNLFLCGLSRTLPLVSHKWPIRNYGVRDTLRSSLLLNPPETAGYQFILILITKLHSRHIANLRAPRFYSMCSNLAAQEIGLLRQRSHFHSDYICASHHGNKPSATRTHRKNYRRRRHRLSVQWSRDPEPHHVHLPWRAVRPRYLVKKPVRPTDARPSEAVTA